MPDVIKNFINDDITIRKKKGQKMISRASILKHPIHPMLVPFPIGLWVFSLLADIIFMAGGNSAWRDTAYYTIAGGIIGALLAAIPGLIDFLSLTNPRVKIIGMAHLIINLVLVALYAINLWFQPANIGGFILPFLLSILGILVLGVSG